MVGAARLAPFNPSSAEVVRSAKSLARVGKSDVVFDLGCGDGRLLIHLAKNAGCRCVGVEYDEKFVSKAKAEVKHEGLEVSNAFGGLVEEGAAMRV